MYQLITESLLGLRLTADRLRFAPCVPVHWQGFKLHYRYRATVYHITVRQTRGARAGMRVSVDGVAQAEPTILLLDDRLEHRVDVDLQQQGSESILP
jgi:cellobiose phosphorylase